MIAVTSPGFVLFAALLAAELAVVCALAAGLFGAPYSWR